MFTQIMNTVAMCFGYICLGGGALMAICLIGHKVKEIFDKQLNYRKKYYDLLNKLEEAGNGTDNSVLVKY